MPLHDKASPVRIGEAFLLLGFQAESFIEETAAAALLS